MEVEVNKENLCINRQIVQKKEIIFVHNDIIVPDTKPDILSTICCNGNVCIYKKEVLDGRVKIDGNVDTYIMYLPDSKSDNLRALNCSIEFSENFAISEVKEGMMVTVEATLKDIECKVLNGRKISVKVGVEFNIKVYSNEDIQIINTVNNIEDIQMLKQDFNINTLIGNGKTSVYAKDTLNIEQTDELAEVLKVNIEIVDKDLKISYNKILAKAELELNILYLTEDNRIGKTTTKIPIVGFIDMQSISEENICDINYTIKNTLIRPNPAEEHSIYVEIELEVSVIAYEIKKINLIQDLYSPTQNLEFTQKNVMSLSDKQENNNNLTVNENIKVQGLSENGLLDVEVIPNLQNTKITNTKIIYSGEIGLNFIYSKDNTVNSRIAKIPFEFNIDNPSGTDKIDVQTEIAVRNSNFIVKQEGDVDATIEMDITTKTSKSTPINIIDNIEILDDSRNEEDYDSLILYIVKDGDTLWKIAKKFNSTVEQIARMNGIENPNKIDVGQKIYIPKFNYIKRENVINA